MNILVTLDGSEFSENAIPVAQRIAAAPGTEVPLMTVADPAAMLAYAVEAQTGRSHLIEWPAPDELEPQMEAALPLDVEMMLEHYLECVARQFPDCVVKPVLRVGPYPAEQII